MFPALKRQHGTPLCRLLRLAEPRPNLVRPAACRLIATDIIADIRQAHAATADQAHLPLPDLPVPVEAMARAASQPDAVGLDLGPNAFDIILGQAGHAGEDFGAINLFSHRNRSLSDQDGANGFLPMLFGRPPRAFFGFVFLEYEWVQRQPKQEAWAASLFDKRRGTDVEVAAQGIGCADAVFVAEVRAIIGWLAPLQRPDLLFEQSEHLGLRLSEFASSFF